jgi:hypothetical protein
MSWKKVKYGSRNAGGCLGLSQQKCGEHDEGRLAQAEDGDKMVVPQGNAV